MRIFLITFFIFTLVLVSLAPVIRADHTCSASTDSGSGPRQWVSASVSVNNGDGYFSIWAYFVGAGIGSLDYDGGPYMGDLDETVKSVTFRPWATGYHSAYINNIIDENILDEDWSPKW